MEGFIIEYLYKKVEWAGLPPWVVDVVFVFFGISYICSVYCSKTATPDPTTKWGKVYAVIEHISGIWGKAKEVGVVITKEEVEKAAIDLVKDVK